jgi:hypothetical protein
MNIENELTKMLQDEITKSLKATPIGYDKANDAYHIGDGIFVDKNGWGKYSAAKKENPELTPKEYQLSEFSKAYEKFLKQKEEGTLEIETVKYVGQNEKHARDMNFGEILDLLKEKDFETIRFKVVDKIFDSWKQFYEEYANEKEIHEQWMGNMDEFTFIWKGQERYPFAYAFPKQENEDGYHFYIQR